VKKLINISILLFIGILLAGCKITIYPTESTIVLFPDQGQTFFITGVPTSGYYDWSLDGNIVKSGTSSYTYQWSGGIHNLVLNAYDESTSTSYSQSWTIVDAIITKNIGPDGGTITINNPSSLAYRTKVNIPAGTFSSTTTIAITAVPSPTNVPGISTGPCISLWAANSSIPSKPVDLYLPYADMNNDGIVDNTKYPETLIKTWSLNTLIAPFMYEPVVDIDTVKNYVHIKLSSFTREPDEYLSTRQYLEFTSSLVNPDPHFDPNLIDIVCPYGDYFSFEGCGAGFDFSSTGYTITDILGPEETVPNLYLYYMGSQYIYPPSTTALNMASFYSTVTLTHDDGQPFSMAGIDLGEIWGEGNYPSATFTGVKVTGEKVSYTVKLDGKNGGEFFTFPQNFSNLVSVQLGPAEQGGYLFHSIVVFDSCDKEPNHEKFANTVWARNNVIP
jgi:hypothetical protein